MRGKGVPSMRKNATRLAAVLLSVIMLVFMCGCDEILNEMLSEYMGSYVYDDGSSVADVGDGGDDVDNIDAQGGDPVVAPTTDFLDGALREPLTKLVGGGRDVVTVMVYICASNLESESGLAFMDIQEMTKATASSKLNIVIETGGCKRWSTSDISGTTNQRHVISDGRLTTIDKRVGRKDMTDGDTLSDFIEFCADEYPANRNILILWDHGAGAIDGWGYDEYNYYDTLTIDELSAALYKAGVTFDFIGFDACLMSTLEVACALYNYADYMIASEDYESGYGWEYQYWLTELARNTSKPTAELAKTICDDFVSESGTADAILCATDLAYTKLMYTAWRDFAFAAKEQLLDSNFSWSSENDGGRLFDLLTGYSTESDIDDMMAIANAVEGVEESQALISVLANAIIYSKSNSGCDKMTGLAVTLPYGDSSGYNSLRSIFGNIGFDDEYIDLLGEFVDVSHGADTYDWSDWYDTFDDYGTWSDYFGDYGDLLTDFDWSDWGGWEDLLSGFLGVDLSGLNGLLDDWGSWEDMDGWGNWDDWDYGDYDYYGSSDDYDYYDYFGDFGSWF